MTDGFGAEGQPPRIPPDATLTINLELVSWKTVENVTDDGAVVKKILKKGEGYDKPREGARASLRYTGRLLDGTIFEERAEGNEHEIVVDEGEKMLKFIPCSWLLSGMHCRLCIFDCTKSDCFF